MKNKELSPVKEKAVHFLAAMTDVYRAEGDRELDAFEKLQLDDDVTEDFTAMLLAVHVMAQEITGFDGDLIDFIHMLNKLAFQYLMEETKNGSV